MRKFILFLLLLCSGSIVFAQDTKTSSLKSDTRYELIIDKGAVRDGANNLNNNSFSLKFKTKEAPEKEDTPENPSGGTSVSQNGFLSVKGTSLVNDKGQSLKLEEAKSFFRIVAGKYKDYPNIIYEIFNEPMGANCSWTNVKAYSEEVIKTIREIDKKNIILVGTPTWSQDVDIAANNPITGYDNLMYVLHFYAATHSQSLRNKANTALQKGLPVFVSECGGMEASGDGPINKQAWQAWLNWMNDNKISWIAWSISDKNETCSMIKNTSSPVSGWTDNDLKEWGLIVKEELLKYKQSQ